MVIEEKPLHLTKVIGMWIGVTTRVHIGFYFFDGSIDTGRYYVRTLQTYVISELKRTDGNAKERLHSLQQRTAPNRAVFFGVSTAASWFSRSYADRIFSFRAALSLEC